MIGLNSPTKAVLQNYGSKYTPVPQNNPSERNKQEHVGDVQKPSANITLEWTYKVMHNINYEFPHGIFFMNSTK